MSEEEVKGGETPEATETTEETSSAETTETQTTETKAPSEPVYNDEETLSKLSPTAREKMQYALRIAEIADRAAGGDSEAQKAIKQHVLKEKIEEKKEELAEAKASGDNSEVAQIKRELAEMKEANRKAQEQQRLAGIRSEIDNYFKDAGIEDAPDTLKDYYRYMAAATATTDSPKARKEAFDRELKKVMDYHLGRKVDHNDKIINRSRTPGTPNGGTGGTRKPVNLEDMSYDEIAEFSIGEFRKK